MKSSKKDKLFIDDEALITLKMLEMGLFSPINKLVNKEEFEKNSFIPLSLILAPAGKRNQEILKKTKKGDIIELFNKNIKKGEVEVEEIFEIDPLKRIKQIYGTNDIEKNEIIKRNYKRLGKYAISGKIKIDNIIKDYRNMILNQAKKINAKKITGFILTASPLHRIHERIIRTSLEESDLLVIFLTQSPNTNCTFPYEIRKNVVQFMINNYFPHNKVLLVPFHTTYVFSGLNEAIINALVAKNYGCNEFVIGQQHKGVGTYYTDTKAKTIFDSIKDFNLNIKVIDHFVYCDICKTIVSSHTCPHGTHHHISYNSDSLLELLKNGLIPPTILMRKEISAKYLSYLFPNRFKNLDKIIYDLVPNKGIIKQNYTDEEFYIKLMNIYQTSSLT